MKKLITNIEIEDQNIYITYFDNSKIKIPYNEINKIKLKEQIRKEKENLEKYKTFSLKVSIFTSLILLIDIIGTLFTYICNNNLFFNLFVSLLSFDIILFNFIFFNEFKKDFKNVNNILNSIENNLLPTEKEYLNKFKVINLKDYILKRKQQLIFNYYDFNYPGYIPKENKKTLNDSPGKILEFKRK